MRKKLAIWVPLSRAAGLGHFYRTLGIYERIGSFFFTLSPSISPPESVRLESLAKADPTDILTFLKAKDVGALYIDHYFLPPATLEYFAMQKEIPTLYFDADFQALPFTALINSNPFADKSCYSKLSPQQTVFLGSEYFIFRNAIEKARGGKKSERIFLCIGGSDPNAVTAQCLEHLNLNYSYDVIVGRGAGREYFARVEKRAAELSPKIQCHFAPDDFFELLASARFAILSASTVTYESAYLGTPFAAIRVVNNQNKLWSFLKKRGIPTLEDTSLTDLKTLQPVSNSPTFHFSEKMESLLAYIQKHLA